MRRLLFIAVVVKTVIKKSVGETCNRTRHSLSLTREVVVLIAGRRKEILKFAIRHNIHQEQAFPFLLSAIY